MFGQVLLEGLFGREQYESIDPDYAFALGQRLGRRSHYGATRLKIAFWTSRGEWDSLREWLLKDLPKEDPLPERRFLPQREPQRESQSQPTATVIVGPARRN